jgi:N-hydroxyarylamine O-acetyltransferase
MSPSTVDSYLRRLGATRSASLAELQERHLREVPFENLSIHLGEPIVLDEEALLDKLLRRGRGGFCYELNGAFAALLRALGHPVELLAARVFDGERLGPPFDHMALRVGDLLVDVGFGRFALRPLSLTRRDAQEDPAGTFRLVDAPQGDVDVLFDGAPQYRLESRPRTLEEFRATCWYHQTWPDSPFRRAARCSRVTPGGRVTLAGSRLVVTEGGERREEALDDAGVLAAYATHFGIRLDRVPRLG